MEIKMSEIGRTEGLKRCRLTYWTGENGESGGFEVVEAIFNDSDLKLLLHGEPPKFIQAIVGDGEWMMIPTENINRLIQIY